MASVLDYLFRADAQQAQNKMADLQLQEKPIQDLIEAQNAVTNSGKLEQSQSRFSSPAYMVAKLIGVLPAASKAALLSDRSQSGMLSTLINTYGQDAVSQGLQLAGVGQRGAPSQPTQQPQTNQGPNQQTIDNGANLISQGAANEYQKATHTGQQTNRSVFGKNVETTLGQIMSIAPSIAKYAGVGGTLNKAGGLLSSALGGQPDPDYENYNTFNNSLLPQATGQLRQFYAGSVQPSEIEKKAKQLSPQPGETAQMYLDRLQTMKDNISAELEQQQQTFSQNYGSSPVSAPVTNSQSQNQNDFLSVLKNKGAQ